MPRRNLYLILSVSLLSIVCYHQVHKSRYGQVLVDVMDQIRLRYIEPVQGSDLFEGAVDGMVRRLGDDYSSYISPAKLPAFQQTLDQQFGGVGMEVAVEPKTKQLLVTVPLFGSPAYEAGIRAGDRITRINGRATQGMALEDAVTLMRGKPGEPVVVTVVHEGEQQPLDITIVRAVIRVDTVLGDTRNNDGTWNFFLGGSDRIGYLRITQFGERTAEELSAAMRWLLDHGMRGLVLDLRDDPGGLLKQAVEVCRLLVRSGVIVTTRGRGGDIRQTYEATGEALEDFPLAVLVNHHSASASEIVAACLQDHSRAVIVGQRTWGKGTVQEVIELGEGQGALKLTTASYWRFSGRNINRTQAATDKDDWGVLPDKGYEVVVDDAEHARWFRWRLLREGRKLAPEEEGPEKGKDLQSFVDRPLAKAVEYLRQAPAAKR